ncbi:hypothetical protein [Spongiibacter marinus]|uniref:hypothetical protein n=1 Tax=Spongiibacter marinus TaxID=354246 RepID=UPI00195F6710|nr:hypothetical protein [Spongiibacter marinus]MBM7424961.1 hypothetical protein [Spongiibacter marinus]
MSWSSIAKDIGKVAPLLGSVLAGPAGGTVGALVAAGLGVDGGSESVAKALGGPDAVAKLKQIEADHRAELEQMAVELAKAEIADVQNARANHKHSPMPAVITLVMTLMALVYGLALFQVNVPDANRDMVNYFGGQLIALWVASVVYWIGTTRSSAEKTRLMS